MIRKKEEEEKKEQRMDLLVTFQVVLHHVQLDNYYVFRSCDVVVELGL